MIKNLPKNMSEIVVAERDETSKKKKGEEKKDAKKKKKKEDDKKAKKAKSKTDAPIVLYPVTIKSDLVASQLQYLTKIFKDNNANGTLTSEFISQELNTSFSSIPEANADIKMFLLFRSLISDQILKEWPKLKSNFKQLCAEDPNGPKHLLSCVVWHYVKWYPEVENKKSIPTVLNSIIEEQIVSKEQMLLWNDKKFKLDKASSLYF